MKRMAVFEEFCQKKSAVLFATDIAARGLDFPGVDWVIQMDCPEDVNSYIHRAGRTARYQQNGESLLMLLPSEEAMVDQMVQKKIPIKKIEVNPSKLQSIQRKMEALLAKDVEMKQIAQRAFVTYCKSIHLMKDKTIFDIQALDFNALARSLGLAVAPRIRFYEKLKAVKDKKAASESKTKSTVETYQFHGDDDDDQGSVDSDDDIIKLKRKDHALDLDESDNVTLEKKKKNKIITKEKAAKKIIRKKIVANKITTFDEEGNVSITIFTK